MDVRSAIATVMTAEGRKDPYPAYRALHRFGPLVKIAEGSFAAVGYETVEQLLRAPGMAPQNTERADRERPGWRDNRAVAMFSGTGLVGDPADHSRVRRQLSKVFTARRLESLRCVVADQAEKLAAVVREQCAGGQVVNAMQVFALPLPVRVMCSIIGVPEPEQPWYEDKVHAMTAVLELSQNPAEMQRAHEVAIELEERLTELVDARRKEPRDDLASGLIQGDVLTQTEVLANLVTLLSSALDSTTYLLGNALVLLADQEKHAEQLRTDDSFAALFVEELLRYDAPIQLSVRHAVSEVKIGDQTLPPEAVVMMLLGAANRDPDRFDDPDLFDPDRPANQPISFGAGPHFCLGAALARMEAQVALPTLLRRLPGLTVAGEPVRYDRFTIRAYESVPVTIAPGAGHWGQ